MIKTTSLELSKKMKELGFPQHRHFGYAQHEDGDHYLECLAQTCEEKHIRTFAAPTAEEVLEQLPARLQFKKKVEKNPDWNIAFIPEDELEELKHAGFLTISNPKRWCVNYLSNACFGVQNMAQVFYDDNSLAEAAGKCWIYLKEQGLLKGKDGK